MAKFLRILPFIAALLVGGCRKKKASDVADAGALAAGSASAAAAATASAPAVAEDPPPTPAQSPKDVPGHHEADKKAQGEITKENYKSVLGDLEKKAK